MERGILNFTIRPIIPFAHQQTATLRHMLTSCKTSLTQKRYTWRHNQVLQQLLIVLEERRTNNSALSPLTHGFSNTTAFVPAGKVPKRSTARKELSLLDTARAWRMKVNRDQRLSFPSEIITTSLRPDLILWSALQEALFTLELMVPWEDAVGEAYERKKLMYSNTVLQYSNTVLQYTPIIIRDSF